MGNAVKGAVTAVGIVLLVGGLTGVLLGLILRQTGIFGAILLWGGVFLAVEGALLLAQAWWGR